jgi:DNA-binding beta-propeller fold protein YncE
MHRALPICVAILAFAAISRGADDLLKHVKTIPLDAVEGRLDHMSVSPDGRRLFIAALGNNSVEVVDVSGGIRAGSIGNIREPQGVLYIPESKKLAVASGGDGKVDIYTDSLQLLGTVHDLDDADNMRYDPRAKLLYLGYGSGALAVINPDKPAKIADIKLDGHPEAFQLETHGPRIFVNVPTARHIAVVDREKNAVIARWPVKDAEDNFPMALDEPNHRLFLACRKPGKLLVLETDNGKTAAALDCCGDADDVFFDWSAKRIYVSGGEGCISIFEQTDADHYRPLGRIPTAPGARTSLFVPEPSVLYLAVPHRGRQRAEIRVYQCIKPG